jgi:hypothetical protein
LFGTLKEDDGYWIQQMVSELTTFEQRRYIIPITKIDSNLEMRSAPVTGDGIFDEEAPSSHNQNTNIYDERSNMSSSLCSDFSSISNESSTSSNGFYDASYSDNTKDGFESDECESDSDTLIISNTMSSISEMTKQSSEGSHSLSNYIFFDARCDADLKTEIEV